MALRELAKTCNFCSEECAQKNIRDQIIEGINDGDTLKHLFRLPNLTLDTAINTCRAQEAARRQRREITEQSPGVILSIKQPQHKTKQPTHLNAPTQPSHTCPRCGARANQGDAKHVLPTINCAITAIKSAIMLGFVKADSPNKRTHKLQSKTRDHQKCLRLGKLLQLNLHLPS